MLLAISYTLTNIYSISKDSLVYELREKVKGIAATSSLLIDPNLVQATQLPADKSKVECKELVHQLKLIKEINTDIEYVWIMRQSMKREGFSEFVAEDAFLCNYCRIG